jgi:hypothetical protein
VSLSAASAAMGIPEALVSRAAAARAAETGASVDEILAAWAGGAPAPEAAPAPAEPAEETAAVETATAPEPAQQEPAAPTPMAPPTPVTAPPTTRPAAPARPPVLVGASDNPMKVFAGVVGLFLVVLLVGLVGPSTPVDPPGERTSAIAFSPQAEVGRDHYRSQGCASCHTQMVRPVIADVGLGLATLNDTNQVLGVRRVGPDLADVGLRLTPDELTAIVTGAGGHPPSGLGGEDLAALVAYLSQSVSGGAR